MQPCLHPGTVRSGLDLSALIRVASSAGFPLVEASARALHSGFAHDPNALHSLLAECDVTPVHCGWSASLRSSRADFDAALPRTAEEMAFVARYGCKGGTLVLPFRHEVNAPDPDAADTLERLRQIADLAAGHSLNVVLEFIGLHIPDAPQGMYRDLPATLVLVEAVSRPNVGVLLDSYHWYLSGGTVAEIAAIPPGTPLFVHINDAPPGDVAALDDSMRLLPGEGVIDLTAFLGTIAARGYTGPVSVEVFSDRLRAMPPEQAARLAYDATIATLTKAVGHRAG